MTELIKTQGFSTSPGDAPITPYQKAANLWDERMGSYRLQARNWRLMALVLAGLLALAITMLVTISGRSTIQPYIIKVAERGEVMSVSPLEQGSLRPDEAMMPLPRMTGMMVIVMSLIRPAARNR